MTDTEQDLAAIDAVLSTTEPARPNPRPRRKPANAQASVPDDDWDADDDDAGGDVVLPPASVLVVPAAVAVEGLPNAEEVPAVADARAAVARLGEQRGLVEAEIERTESALGLKPGASARDIEALAVRLLVEGKPDDTTQLEALRVRQRRLAAAGEIATQALNGAREKARRELSARAAQAEYLPAVRASALALLAVIGAKRAEEDARDRLRAAGFAPPSGSFPNDGILDTLNNSTLIHLVRNGHLTRQEVGAACPHMSI